MSGTDSIPATPDELVSHDKELDMPASPGSDDTSSAASTPLDGGLESPSEIPKRVPSLRSVSDPRALNPNSTALGVLGMARKPIQATSSFAGASGMALDNNSAMAKARALHQQRLQKASTPTAGSPTSPAPSPAGGPLMNGFPANLRMPPGLQQRPGPPAHPNSSPAVPASGLAARRRNMMGGMSLSDMGAGGSPGPGPGMKRPGGLKLSDITGDSGVSQANGQKHGSQMDDFKKYIDTEKGWITFDGAATITREGVNFSNGHTFSISLDEVEKLDELGKGNYGTVYKVKHSRPRVPRFGQGLSGPAHKHLQHTASDPSPIRRTQSEHEGNSTEDGTSGITMAMKEIRLELDDAKFTTILKELVILHECVSPYIIDFYGAFFQEGAVYICIEYMDGGSIDKLYGGGIPEEVLRKITYSTVQGLKSLKDDHNIIHRDVKPTNILVNTRGQVKICDFGVSGNLVASIARTNIGCQSYMAPERISGGSLSHVGNADGSYSVQSDIWSLGLTIIECAKGAYPYPPEVSQSIFSQLNVSQERCCYFYARLLIHSQAIVEGEPPGLPEEGYSDLAKDFVRSCLNKIPKLRPPYALLLKHPWLKSLSNPQTITEEAEDGEEADAAAEAVGKMNLSGTEDEEVAAWVKGVFARKAAGDDVSGGSKPALHAAPLDSISPVTSPVEKN